MATPPLCSVPAGGPDQRATGKLSSFPVWRVLLLCLAACSSACVGNSRFSVDATPDGLLPDWGNHELPTVYRCDAIDILFVIDNSDSMTEEQQNLVQSFPKLVQRIEAIEPPIRSYHLGVISTDLGAGDTATATCLPGGDDGKLQHLPRAAGCKQGYPAFLEGPAPEMAQDFACIAQLGTDGCGYEQQLEAALKALTDQPYNAGFLRPNAPLAIIFITDEDDCSTFDSGLFDPDDVNMGHPPTRCVRLLDKLYPISRYIEGFKGLKDNPERLVVAAITGPAGEVQIDPYINVVPICSSEAFGQATPGNRFSELVAAFGERGVLANLCDGDLVQPLDLIGQAIERVCLE